MITPRVRQLIGYLCRPHGRLSRPQMAELYRLVMRLEAETMEAT